MFHLWYFYLIYLLIPFSYQLSFTWFCIGFAALCYLSVLFIFNSPLNTTNIVLLHWSWQFWSRPTHWQTSHHLLLLLWQNRHLPIYLQPGKVHETMLIIHLWQKNCIGSDALFAICHSSVSRLACLQKLPHHFLNSLRTKKSLAKKVIGCFTHSYLFRTLFSFYRDLFFVF